MLQGKCLERKLRASRESLGEPLVKAASLTWGRDRDKAGRLGGLFKSALSFKQLLAGTQGHPGAKADPS